MVFGKGKTKALQLHHSPLEQRHHIVVTQIPGTVNYKDRVCINVEIKLDDGGEEKTPIYDPLEEHERLICNWYLNDFLNGHNFVTREAYGKAIGKAQLAAENIKSYGINLHHQLRQALSSQWPSLRWPIVEVDIHDCALPTSDSPYSIFDLRWEQLEACELWDHAPTPTVIVRRIVSSPQNQPVQHAPGTVPLSESVSMTEAPSVKKNILLVIARDLEDPPKKGRPDISPALAQSVITELRGISNTQEQFFQLTFDLEVVRPGSFKALKEHLALKPWGYFHLVHFDAHGIIKSVEEPSSSGVLKAYLQLSHDELKRFDLQDVPAADIAEALRAKGVRQVVLNACSSAKTHLGVEANLGRIFAREKLFRTLAMSFNIWGTAVPILCSGFYAHLLEHNSTFSEAATHARRALRAQPSRRECPRTEVQDWIVPVTYSSGSDETLMGTRPRTPNPKPIIPSKMSFKMLLLPFSNVSIKSGRSSVSLSTTKSFTSLWSSGSYNARPVSVFDAENFLVMDNDILKMEKMLLTTGVLFLHGSETRERRRLLSYLTDSWITTNFLRKVYRVKGTSPESIENARQVFKDYRELAASSSLTTRPSKSPNIAIIIEHVDVLFESSSERQEANPYQQSLSRFLNDISKQFYQSLSSKSAPYLIIVGVDRQLMLRHFQAHYAHIGGPSHMYKGPCNTYHIKIS